MKNIFIILFSFIPITIIAQSSIELTTGTNITIEAGADVCADNRIGLMNYTGNGTWCTGPIKINLQFITGLPEKFNLYQNFPNPYNSSTKILFDIAISSKIKITVFNLLGKEVATLVEGLYQPGFYNLNFYGNDMISGVYFYELQYESGDKTNMKITRKMVVIK